MTQLETARRDLDALRQQFRGTDIPVAIASTIQRLEAIIRKLESDAAGGNHEQEGSQ